MTLMTYEAPLLWVIAFDWVMPIAAISIMISFVIKGFRAAFEKGKKE